MLLGAGTAVKRLGGRWPGTVAAGEALSIFPMREPLDSVAIGRRRIMQFAMCYLSRGGRNAGAEIAATAGD